MKKTFCILGIIIGALVVVLGICTVAGVLGGYGRSASSASYLYDSGYATFGADFYNYVSNNAAEAASASRTAANNLDEIACLLRNAIGYGFIAFGLLSVCGFGAACADCGRKKSDAIGAAPETASPAAVQPEPTETKDAAPEAAPAEAVESL